MGSTERCGKQEQIDFFLSSRPVMESFLRYGENGLALRRKLWLGIVLAL
jgi:hypothetical protein